MHALQHTFTELPHLDDEHSQTGHATAYVSGGGGVGRLQTVTPHTKLRKYSRVIQQVSKAQTTITLGVIYLPHISQKCKQHRTKDVYLLI
jgi:hypothetical protein